jgi:AcrR family transcriptional regulator
MNLRDLAAEVGIKAGSPYNHIETKQALLLELIREHLENLLASTEAALPDAANEPLAQLHAFATHHVLYHLEKRQEAYIAYLELQSLDPSDYFRIVDLRRAYKARLIGLLEAGASAGELSVADAPVNAFAMLAMLPRVHIWYRPSGRLSKATLALVHTELALDGLRRRAGG